MRRRVPWRNRKSGSFWDSVSIWARRGRSIAPKALDKFKERVREITLGSRGRSMQQTIEALSRYVQGWIAYFGFSQTLWVLKDLDSLIRRRIRCAFWRQWTTSRKRRAELPTTADAREIRYPDPAGDLPPAAAAPFPTHGLARFRQTRLPKLIQPELMPQLAG